MKEKIYITRADSDQSLPPIFSSIDREANLTPNQPNFHHLHTDIDHTAQSRADPLRAEENHQANLHPRSATARSEGVLSQGM